DYLLIRFTGYDSINEVESFKGLMLKIKNEQLTPLNEHEFYFHEIIGCTVSDMSGTKIGVVDSILTPGANDVWVVKNDQHKEYLLIRFTGYDSMNEVESFKGLMLKIKNEQLTPLNEHEFYFHEIIGCTVSDMSGTKIGVVDSILTPGANDVWVVKNDQHKEF